MRVCQQCGCSLEAYSPCAIRCHKCAAERLRTHKRSGRLKAKIPCKCGCGRLVTGGKDGRAFYEQSCRDKYYLVQKADRLLTKALSAIPKEPRIYRRNCRFCGTEVTSTSSYLGRGRQGTVCPAVECLNQKAKEWAQARALVKSGPLPPPKPCRRCGFIFTPTSRKERFFCSPACEAAFHKFPSYRKKARALGVTFERVNPKKVFERDNWICQHCGKPVRKPQYKTGGYTWSPDQPELDHRLPMNDVWKGPHTYANTQCLCAMCNGLKGGAESGLLQDLWAHEPMLFGMDEVALFTYRQNVGRAGRLLQAPAGNKRAFGTPRPASGRPGTR